MHVCTIIMNVPHERIEQATPALRLRLCNNNLTTIFHDQKETPAHTRVAGRMTVTAAHAMLELLSNAELRSLSNPNNILHR